MKKEAKSGPRIKVTKNGPYVVDGKFALEREEIICDKEGYPLKWKKVSSVAAGNCALCRCGKSRNKPNCDGSHVTSKFDGTETAENGKFKDRAEKTEGPTLTLLDLPDLCVSARFCHRAGDAWNLTEKSGDPVARKTAIEEACNCPSGRLVAVDKKTGKEIEPEFKPSISLLKDPNGVSGPLWVKGRIPIESADGTCYEVRNRMTLCRCGKSKNKPFCDSTHISINFRDDAD